jgi:hypothetical protein
MTLAEAQEQGHKLALREYGSMGEFIADMDNGAKNQHWCAHPSPAWNGARSYAEALRIIRDGIPKYQAEIQSLVDKVSVELPSMQDQWVADVAGCAPIVPAAIAGLPDNMLRLEQQETSGVPLRIFVSTVYSAGCELEMIARRGVAIMALLESLAAKRPVELMLFADLDYDGRGFASPVVRVDSMPLDRTALTAALVSPVVSRMLMMSWCGHNAHYTGGWAWGTEPTDPTAQALTREALGAKPEDLVLFGAYLSERDLILKDPVKWVQQQVALTEKGLQDG